GILTNILWQGISPSIMKCCFVPLGPSTMDFACMTREFIWITPDEVIQTGHKYTKRFQSDEIDSIDLASHSRISDCQCVREANHIAWNLNQRINAIVIDVRPVRLIECPLRNVA